MRHIGAVQIARQLSWEMWALEMAKVLLRGKFSGVPKHAQMLRAPDANVANPLTAAVRVPRASAFVLKLCGGGLEPPPPQHLLG